MSVRIIVPTVTIAQTPTITSGSAYASGQALGGLLTFSLAANQMQGSGRITQVTISDISNQRSACDLVLFNQTFTPTTDKTAFAPSNADLLNAIGFVNIPAANYAQFNANALATVQVQSLKFNLPDSVVVGNSTQRIQAKATTIFGQLVCRGTPTYTSTSAITVSITIEQD